MTTANMKLVVLDVPLDGDMESPEQNLEDGESIVRHAIEVKDLYKVLKGTRGSSYTTCWDKSSL
jgi:ADP-ribose pyrophosphatase